MFMELHNFEVKLVTQFFFVEQHISHESVLLNISHESVLLNSSNGGTMVGLCLNGTYHKHACGSHGGHGGKNKNSIWAMGLKPIFPS